jgi:solute carrier family 45 protein 1/2/4
VATVWITCICHEEEERPKARRPQREYALSFISRTIFAELRARNLRDVVNNIYTAAINLPKPIRRVCYVQLFAFLAWSVIHVFEGNILILFS